MAQVLGRIFTPTPPWMKDRRVKCRGLSPALFYPNSPSSDVSKAKALCNGTDGTAPCYFRDTCLHYAIDEHEQFGVWGGTSERDRRKIWRARRVRKDDTIYSIDDIKRDVTVTTITIRRVI